MIQSDLGPGSVPAGDVGFIKTSLRRSRDRACTVAQVKHEVLVTVLKHLKTDKNIPRCLQRDWDMLLG